MKKIPEHRENAQRGVALIEAMISIIVLAIGVLGVLGLQLRTLVETQQSANRALAVRLAEDFSERVKNNPNAEALLATNFVTGGWVSAGVPVDPGNNCRATGSGIGCAPDELADQDQYQWLQNVLSVLPNAQVNVFRSTREQIGILFAWDGNMRMRNGDAGAGNYRNIYNVQVANYGIAPPTCPPGGNANVELVCHLVYISY